MNLRPACDTHWVSGKDVLLREAVSQAEEEMGVCYVIATKLGLGKSGLKFPQSAKNDCIWFKSSSSSLEKPLRKELQTFRVLFN